MRQIKKGSTDRSAYIRIIDSTDGTPETGVVYNTSGIAMWYRREGATQTAITEATLSALDSAHSDGGIIHIGDGYYRLDLPDAAFATGANSVIVGGAVTGMIVIGEVIQLVNHDVEDGVRLGLTALPNAAADAAGGLPISDAGGLDLDTLLARLDAAISTRLASSGYTAPANSDIATILSRIIGTLAPGTHYPQSGDAYPIVNNGTYGNSALNTDLDTLLTRITAAVALNSDVSTLLTRLSSDRAGYLDKLNITGNVAATGEAASALASYDPPTKAELDSAVSPLATSSALSAVAGYVDTEVASIKAVTDKLDTALEADSAVYRFTTNALENAPSGGAGGGDATAANQTIIIGHLADIKGSTFSGTTDSLEAIRDRGDSAWITGGGASGSNAITITVTDTSDANIIDAAVEIWDSAGTSFIERKASNSSGQAVFNLDLGTYTVKLHKVGYSIANQTLVVSGAASVTYEMTAYVIPAPFSAEMCRVYKYYFMPNGGIYTSLNPVAEVAEYSESNSAYMGRSAGVYNSTTGLVYWDVPRGATVRLTISEIGVDETVTAPESATAALDSLI